MDEFCKKLTLDELWNELKMFYTDLKLLKLTIIDVVNELNYRFNNDKNIQDNEPEKEKKMIQLYALTKILIEFDINASMIKTNLYKEENKNDWCIDIKKIFKNTINAYNQYKITKINDSFYSNLIKLYYYTDQLYVRNELTLKYVIYELVDKNFKIFKQQTYLLSKLRNPNDFISEKTIESLKNKGYKEDDIRKAYAYFQEMFNNMRG